MFLKTLTWKGWKKCEYFSGQPVITLIRTESDYPDKKATDLLQVVYQLAKNFQQVATNLSVSSNGNKSAKIRLVALRHLQTCNNLLKQLAAKLWITSFDNQLATRLLTTCNRLVIKKLSQAIRTHPDRHRLVGYKSVARCQN